MRKKEQKKIKQKQKKQHWKKHKKQKKQHWKKQYVRDFQAKNRVRPPSQRDDELESSDETFEVVFFHDGTSCRVCHGQANILYMYSAKRYGFQMCFLHHTSGTMCTTRFLQWREANDDLPPTPPQRPRPPSPPGVWTD